MPSVFSKGILVWWVTCNENPKVYIHHLVFLQYANNVSIEQQAWVSCVKQSFHWFLWTVSSRDYKDFTILHEIFFSVIQKMCVSVLSEQYVYVLARWFMSVLGKIKNTNSEAWHWLWKNSKCFSQQLHICSFF